jgi:hypothetical protein
MPVFALTVSATLDACTLAIADPPTFPLRVLFTCTACREPAPKHAVLALADPKCDVPGGRGQATYVAKCAACKAVASADVLGVLATALTPEAPAAALARLECRGVEPTGWQAGEGWRVGSAGGGGASWEASFLGEESFSEYDEGAEAAVEASGVTGAWKKE